MALGLCLSLVNLKIDTKVEVYYVILLRKIKRRYSQVVRPWIANPLPPVRIWVPPNYIITIVLSLIAIKDIL